MHQIFGLTHNAAVEVLVLAQQEQTVVVKSDWEQQEQTNILAYSIFQIVYLKQPKQLTTCEAVLAFTVSYVLQVLLGKK